ncbi:MAG: SHOCT domain-containing protein [Bacillota bacterium]
MMGFGYGGGFGGSFLWGLYMLFQMTIPIIIIIGAIWFAAKVWDRKKNTEKDPLRILQERYANGEISREEFVEMKKELKNNA